MVAKTTAGRRAYLLEWKYVEKYSVQYKGRGTEGENRLQRYSVVYSESAFLSESFPITAWLYEPFYQIMRLQLLAERMVKREELGVQEAKVVVVVPEDNHPFRDKITSPVLSSKFPNARTVEEVVQSALVHADKRFACVSPGLMADAVRQECGNDVTQWSDYLKDRYGW